MSARRPFWRNPTAMAAWLGLAVAILGVPPVILQNVDVVCRATGIFCDKGAQRQSAPAAPALDAFVETFELSDPAHPDLVWLRTKVERNLVEILWSNKHSVGHALTPANGGAGARFRFIGEIDRNGDSVALAVSMREGNRVVGTTEISAPLATFKEAYRALPSALLYFMGRSATTLGPATQARRPTESLLAWWMFEEARRRARFQQKDEAIRFLDAALAADPQFATALWAKGELLAASGDHAGAAMQQRALAQNPDLHHLSIAVAPVDPMPALRAAAASAPWRMLEPGLAIRRFEARDYGVRVIAWSVSPARFDIGTTASREGAGESVSVMRARTDAILAINGGFWDQDAQGRLTPSGLLVADGAVVQPVREGAGSGLFLVSGSGPKIQYARDPTPPNLLAAVQSGPILIEPGGAAGIRANDGVRTMRTSVCATPQAIVFVVVQGGLSLYELADLLAAPGGFACAAALNLDGGPSTQASFSAHGEAIEITGLWRTQSAIVVRRRKGD